MGIPSFARYTVLSLALGRKAGSGEDRIDLDGKAAKLHACLDAFFRRPVPALLSAAGGIVFVPTTSPMAGADPVSDAVSTLAATAAQPIVATTTEAAADELPAAAHLANELLDLALRLGQPPGVYRLADLAMEYQLTRPGYAKQRLARNVESRHTISATTPNKYPWQRDRYQPLRAAAESSDAARPTSPRYQWRSRESPRRPGSVLPGRSRSRYTDPAQHLPDRPPRMLVGRACDGPSTGSPRGGPPGWGTAPLRRPSTAPGPARRDRSARTGAQSSAQSSAVPSPSANPSGNGGATL